MVQFLSLKSDYSSSIIKHVDVFLFIAEIP